MNSTFQPLICTLKAALIFLLLQYLDTSHPLLFPLFSFCLYSFSSDIFILIIGMFLALSIGESRRKRKKTIF